MAGHWLEAALLGEFQRAMTPAIVNAIVRAVNAGLQAGVREGSDRASRLKEEILRLEREAGNLVRFLADGKDSPTVRATLETAETALKALRLELAGIDLRLGAPAGQVKVAWVREKLREFRKLLRHDPVHGKHEIMKHLDGDLVVSPLQPEEGHAVRAEITGRVKAGSLLEGQEAACLRLVAGAHSHRW